jgi:hypothetical protein
MGQYLLTYWQPILGLIIGIAMIALYLYLYNNRNKKIVPWIAKSLFKNQNMGPSADSLLKVVSSFLFMVGGLMVIFALLYLTH